MLCEVSITVKLKAAFFHCKNDVEGPTQTHWIAEGGVSPLPASLQYEIFVSIPTA